LTSYLNSKISHIYQKFAAEFIGCL